MLADNVGIGFEADCPALLGSNPQRGAAECGSHSGHDYLKRLQAGEQDVAYALAALDRRLGCMEQEFSTVKNRSDTYLSAIYQQERQRNDQLLLRCARWEANLLKLKRRDKVLEKNALQAYTKDHASCASKTGRREPE